MWFNSSKIIKFKKTDNVNGAQEQEMARILYYFPLGSAMYDRLPVADEDKHTFTRWP